MNNDLRAAVREAISNEWHRRIAGQLADTPDGHVDALTNAVMDRLARVDETTTYADRARGVRLFVAADGSRHEVHTHCAQHGGHESTPRDEVRP